MRHKLGENLTIKFLVLNKEKQRVTVANPICQIFNLRTEKYWNGAIWQDSEVNLNMSHFEAGIYLYSFTPNELGVYEIRLCEYVNNVFNTYHVSVEEFGEYETGLVGYIGEVTHLKFLAQDSNDGGAKVAIFNNGTNKYYYNGSWNEEKLFENMENLDKGLYVFSFTPDEEGYYTIQCQTLDGEYSVSYPLKVMDSRYKRDPDAPIYVSDQTLLGEDGSNSVVVDEYGLPIGGATVSIYSVTGDLCVKTTTKSDGSWNTFLAPGKYIFIFEKEGYTTASVERVVDNADKVIEIV